MKQSIIYLSFVSLLCFNFTQSYGQEGPRLNQATKEEIRRFNAAAPSKPAESQASIDSAKHQEEMKMLHASLDRSQSLIDQNPGRWLSIVGYAKKAETYKKLGNPDQAKAMYQKAEETAAEIIANNSTNLEAFTVKLRLAGMYSSMENYPAAIKQYQEVFSQWSIYHFPDSQLIKALPSFYTRNKLRLGECQTNIGDTTAAIATYKELISKQFSIPDQRDRYWILYNKADAQYRISELYQNNGLKNKAIEEYKKVITDYSDNINGNGFDIKDWKKKANKHIGLITGKLYSADTEIPFDRHLTLLMEAVSQQDLKTVKQILAKGVEVNAHDNISGATALMSADTAAIPLLLAYGANINAKDNSGATALMRAASKGDFDIVDLLITHGADIHAQDNNGETALTYALMQYNTVDTDIIKIIKLLLSPSVKLYEKDHSYNSVIPYALAKPVIAKILFTAGVDPNTKNSFGETGLFIAVHVDSTEAVNTLLQHGANIDSRDYLGWTPLMFASALGNNRVVQTLLVNGAKINATNNYGETALMWAARCGRTDTVKLLLAKGAAVDLKTKRKQTALSWAKKEGHTEIIRILKQFMVKE
ncbi:MAG: ankyrin repeat domain-containing protein [bacterium]